MPANFPKFRTKKKLEKEIVFEFFAPQAEKVQLAGNFNDWSPTRTPLRRERDGKWVVNLQLPQGHYEYRYLVDGNWQNDQRPVGCVPNAFGTWNCVVEVS